MFRPPSLIDCLPRQEDEVGGFCCPAPPGPRASYFLGSRPKCNVVVGTYGFGPITAVPYRAKTDPLPRTSILFHPHNTWWRRRVPPPGPKRLFHKSFIAIVSYLTIYKIGCFHWKKKGFNVNLVLLLKKTDKRGKCLRC